MTDYEQLYWRFYHENFKLNRENTTLKNKIEKLEKTLKKSKSEGKTTYRYESPDNGKTVYRTEIDTDKKVLVKGDVKDCLRPADSNEVGPWKDKDGNLGF